MNVNKTHTENVVTKEFYWPILHFLVAIVSSVLIAISLVSFINEDRTKLPPSSGEALIIDGGNAMNSQINMNKHNQ